MTQIQEPLEAVDKVVRTAIKETVPKFDNIFRVDVLFKEGGRWYTVDVNAHEFLKILQSGEFEDRQLTGVSVVEMNTELTDGSTETVRFVYDFVLKHTEHDPWRIV